MELWREKPFLCMARGAEGSVGGEYVDKSDQLLIAVDLGLAVDDVRSGLVFVEQECGLFFERQEADHSYYVIWARAGQRLAYALAVE
jgi:hypothetical protein